MEHIRLKLKVKVGNTDTSWGKQSELALNKNQQGKQKDKAFLIKQTVMKQTTESNTRR